MGVPEEITSTLEAMYAKKGRDFTFKCRLLAKKLKYPGQKVSRNMPNLEKKGIIVKKEKSRKSIVYKTCFKGGGKDTSHM